MRSHIFFGKLNRTPSKYAINITTLMIKYSKFLEHIFEYFDIFKGILLIIREYLYFNACFDKWSKIKRFGTYFRESRSTTILNCKFVIKIINTNFYL